MPLKNILLQKKICLALLFTNFLYNQNTINLDVDNDLYFAKDFYYSSGIFLTYSKFAKSKNEKALINHFTIGQEIYTPSSPFFIKDEADPIKYDYRHKKGTRVKRYRQQQEYGEKMRIKP